MTFNLCPSWPDAMATWPARHARYRIPAMYEPWDLCPDWLAELIRQAAKAAGAPNEWVVKCIRSAIAAQSDIPVKRVPEKVKLDQLNVAQAISLFDVMFEKTGRTRAAVAEPDSKVETADESIRHDRSLAA